MALEGAEDVAAVLDLATRNPLLLGGRPVRLARAAMGAVGDGSAGGRAGAPDPALDHPRAVAARAAARAVADAALAQGGGGGGGVGGRPQGGGRELVSYDDL